jgi:hypothetical protein
VNEHKSAHRWTDWSETSATELPLTSGAAAEAVRDAHPKAWPYLAVEVQKSRGHDWSRPVRAYVSRGSDAVVAVAR